MLGAAPGPALGKGPASAAADGLGLAGTSSWQRLHLHHMLQGLLAAALLAGAAGLSRLWRAEIWALQHRQVHGEMT